MLNIIKNYKLVIATSLISIIFGLLTFFVFTNQSFTTLKDTKLQALLAADVFLLIFFLVLSLMKLIRYLKKEEEKS